MQDEGLSLSESLGTKGSAGGCFNSGVLQGVPETGMRQGGLGPAWALSSKSSDTRWGPSEGLFRRPAVLGKVTSGSSCSLTPLLSLTQGVLDSYTCPCSSYQIPAVSWLLRATLTPPAAVAIPDLSLPHGTSARGIRVKLLACSEHNAGVELVALGLQGGPWHLRRGPGRSLPFSPHLGTLYSWATPSAITGPGTGLMPHKPGTFRALLFT